MNRKTRECLIALAAALGLVAAPGCERGPASPSPPPVQPAPPPAVAEPDADRSEELRAEVERVLAQVSTAPSGSADLMKSLLLQDPKGWFLGHFPRAEAEQMFQARARSADSFTRRMDQALSLLVSARARVNRVERCLDPDAPGLPSSLRKALRAMNPREAWYLVHFTESEGKPLATEWWFVREAGKFRLFEVMSQRPR